MTNGEARFEPSDLNSIIGWYQAGKVTMRQLCAALNARLDEKAALAAPVQSEVGAGERALAQKIIDLPCIVEVRGPDVVGQIAELLSIPESVQSEVGAGEPLNEFTPIIEAHLKREMTAPANHQEFQQEASEKLDRWYALAARPDVGTGEAMNAMMDRIHRMAIELDGVPCQPRIEFWTRQVEEIRDKWLASRREGRLLTKQECWEAWSSSQIKGPVALTDWQMVADKLNARAGAGRTSRRTVARGV